MTAMWCSRRSSRTAALYRARRRRLRNDREVVLAAVKQDGLYALKWAEGIASAADREVVLAAVKQNGLYRAGSAGGLRADREVVLAAVKHDGHALCVRRRRPQGRPRGGARGGHEQDGRALEYAEGGLRADREVVLAAVRDGWRSSTPKAASAPTARWCSRRSRRTAEGCSGQKAASAPTARWCSRRSSMTGRALEYAEGGLKADREVVLAAVKAERQRALLRSTTTARLARVKRQRALQFAEGGLNADREVVLEAVKQ